MHASAARIVNDMQFHSEGGLELLSRFNEKPRTIVLDGVLFPDGVSNESVVEIVGASSTGKTLLLCQFLARCVLPMQYDGIEIDGCDACAILIDTLGHVRISKIAELVTSALSSAYQTAGVRQPPVETVNSVVTKSLENLLVINCCNNDQFQLTLHTLEDELLGNKRIALLAIDSVMTYYWQERREKGIISMDSYVRSLIRVVRARTSQFRIATVYTRWDGPESENESRVRRANLSEGIDYKLQLRKSNVTREFLCHMESANDTKRISYTICNSGIKWIL